MSTKTWGIVGGGIMAAVVVGCVAVVAISGPPDADGQRAYEECMDNYLGDLTLEETGPDGAVVAIDNAERACEDVK